MPSDITSLTAIPRVARRKAGAVASPPKAMAAANVDPAIFDIGWGGHGGRASHGLPPVRAQLAERHATVFSCCEIIAGDLAKIPLRVMQQSAQGNMEPVAQHPLGYLLNVEASPGIAAKPMRFALFYAYLLRGRSYAYAPRNGAGEVDLIDALWPDQCAHRKVGRDVVYDLIDHGDVSRSVTGRQIAHLRYAAKDGWTGRSPIEVAADSMALVLQDDEAAARAATGSNIRAVAKLSGFHQGEEAYERDQRRLRTSLRERDAIPIIGSEDDIKALNLSQQDFAILTHREFDREVIAGIYRVPPSKLQILKYGVKANGQQQALDYKTDCLLHWAGLILSDLQLGLLTMGERRRGLTLAFDYDALMDATLAEKADAIVKLTGGPVETPNEGRARLGKGPIPGGNELNPAPNMTRDSSGAQPEGDDDDDSDDN